jgi:hypothetical protein
LGWSKKKFKMADSKKLRFSTPPILNNFFPKFSWIGTWVSRINWCQGHQCDLTYMVIRLSDMSSKKGKKCFFCVFSPFWAHIGQPDHIGWATMMPFASIYLTNPRTNPWNFCKKILRISVFCVSNFEIFFLKKKKKLLHPNEN